MSLLKCLIYGLIIAILVIIIIKLFSSVKENFNEIIKNDAVDDKMPSPDDVEVNKENKEIQIIPEEKNIISSVVDNVKDKIIDVKDDVKDKIIDVKDDIKDKLTSDNIPSTQPDDKQEDINILPKFMDNVSNSIMDAPKMIPESAYSPWANVYMNDDGDNSFMIDLGDGSENKDGGSGRFSERSPACCSAQYPIPFQVKINDKVMKNKDEYVPNPYMGNNNWENAGCTCMTRENAIKLAKRGYNA